MPTSKAEQVALSVTVLPWGLLLLVEILSGATGHRVMSWGPYLLLLGIAVTCAVCYVHLLLAKAARADNERIAEAATVRMHQLYVDALTKILSGQHGEMAREAVTTLRAVSGQSNV